MNVMMRLLCLLVLVGLCLSAQPYVLKATIPFQFEVSNIALPAGEYTVERMQDNPNVAVVWLADRNTKAIIATFPVAQADNSKKIESKLLFRRYGNGADARYFLFEVWTDAAGSRLHKSRSERDAESAVMIAGQTPETIVIYARR